MPIAIDGMVILASDIVIGDSEGVLSVPIAATGDLLKATQTKSASENSQMAAIEAGTNDRSWVDRALQERGCIRPQD